MPRDVSATAQPMESGLPLVFAAGVIRGSGRGKGLGTPTLNLELSAVPKQLMEGIYACHAKVDGRWENAVMHYGPRPVFRDIPSCEVHLLDRTLEETPASVDVRVASYLREVRDFPSPLALSVQIAADIEQSRGILRAWESDS